MTTKERDQLAGMLRIEWSELGATGRMAFIALIMSAVVAFVIAIAIPRQAESFILSGHADSLANVVGDLGERGLIPLDASDLEQVGALDDAVQHRLLGADIVRVKIWARDGTVVYSDNPDLVGNQYPLSNDVAAAFSGETRIREPDLSRQDNAAERDMEPLREFYLPVEIDDGSVGYVYEVYELAAPLLATIGEIRRYVWLSVFVGIGFLAIFVFVLVLTGARRGSNRRRQAEQLLSDVIHAQDEERKRIVGSLHDDIGQPLYRIHFGLEDCLARVPSGSPIEKELVGIGELVHEVDRTLRNELRVLNAEPGAEIDIAEALRELGRTIENEAELPVDVRVNGPYPLTAVHRVALYRAAKEALTNVRKHAYATRVDITVRAAGDSVVLDVEDDGVGIAGTPGLGLTTTRERLEAIGGGLRVRSRRIGGTRFRAWVPEVDRGGAE